MSAQSLRTALGLLHDDPDHATATETLSAVASTGQADVPVDEALGLLLAAQRSHESRREWDALVLVLQAALAVAKGRPEEIELAASLARVLDSELIEDKPAVAAWERVLELRPGDEEAKEALERLSAARDKSKELVKRYVAEVELSTDPPFKSALLMSAAEVAVRFGGKKKAATKQIASMLEQAVGFDPKNKRAALLLERIYRRDERWDDVAKVITSLSQEADTNDERVAALLRLARLHRNRTKDADASAAAYEAALDLTPGHPEALEFLSRKFSENQQWDHLVALYEDQWKSGGVKQGDELGVLVQIAMTHWKMRQRPDSAETWFERVRKIEPTQPAMLGFFRERLLERGDRNRLVAVLQDAQRALPEGPARAELAQEIARLAEDGANAGKAIEQYKAILRSDPGNQEARESLRRLYTQTESWNALVELLRQDLERLAADDRTGRLARLREIATIYRVHIKSDTALVTVLSQIVQLDETDRGAIEDLVRVYEALGRFRDLLTYQQKLAALTEDALDKMELYRAIANRWLDQFNNVANAIEAFEALLAVEPRDAEALAKLRELYGKRRAWKELYELSARELGAVKGADRLPLLLEMAKMAAERLDRGPDAIKHWKEALSIDPASPGALDALEKQAERERDFETLAEALSLRADAAADEAAKVAALTKLGTVLTERLQAHDRAAKAFRRVLELQPGNAKALRVLRETFLASGDLDALEELYGSQGDWDGLADVLSSSADKADDKANKITLSLRAARIYASKVGQPERAVRSYERVLSVEPGHDESVRALIPIYERDERYGKLAPLYESLYERATSDDEKLDLLASLVRVGQKTGDKAGTLAAAKRAVAIAPKDRRALDLLAEAARGTGDHAALAGAIESRLADEASTLPVDEANDLRRRLIDLYAGEMGQADKAVALLKELVVAQPEETSFQTSLDQLLRRTDRRDDLRWLFEHRVERGGGDKAEILREWATLEEDAFSEPTRAAALFGRVLELTPDDTEALRAHARLLRAQGDAKGAVGSLSRLRDLADGGDRAKLELDVAELQLSALNEPEPALEATLRAIELDASEGRALGLLEELAKHDATKARAAEALTEAYARGGDSRREAEALRTLLATATEPARRVELTVRLADVHEHKLRAPGAAFDVLLATLLTQPGELELWDRAIALTSPTGRATDVAEAMRMAFMAELSPEVEVELAQRAAQVYDDRLGNPEAAIPYLERVLARRPEDETAFARLKQVLTSTERWGQLQEQYEKVVRATPDRGRQAELLSEVALICEEITQESGKAIHYYERILDLDPSADTAIRALDALYQAEKRHADLAKLLEKRLPDASGEVADTLRLRLAHLYIEHLHDPERAAVILKEHLDEHPKSDEGRDLAEKLLTVGSQKLAAAAMLEGVYEARDDARDLVRVLDIRLDAEKDDEARKELLRRLAALRDERLKDDAGAFRVLSELVPMDPSDHVARERLSDIGRRLSAHAELAAVLTRAAGRADKPVKAEILMRVGAVYDDFVGDRDRAAAVYEEVIAIDPEDADTALPAARALEVILAGKGDVAGLVRTLELEAKLATDGDQKREILGRVGELAETQLADFPRAITAWKARHEDDPSDVDALAALERLYERTGQNDELVATLRLREQAEASTDGKKRTLEKLAERLVLLGRDDDAIAAYRTLIDETGPTPSAQAALSKLYERTAKHADLADSLQAELDLAASPEARVALLVRLGDVRKAHLDETPNAIEAYREALTIEPGSTAARDALTALLDDPDARRDAAELLHPLFEADGQFDRLLRVLSIQADLADSDAEKLDLLEKATRTAEGPLGDARLALGFAFRGLRAAVAEPSLVSWVDRAEHLSRAVGDLGSLVNELSKIAPDVLDEDPKVVISMRIANVARTDLSDRAVARTWFEKALELRPEDRSVLTALESLHEEMGSAPELLEVLKRRAEVAESDDERRGLLHRQAKLVRSQHGAGEAIRVYEQILDLGLDGAAVAELYALYEIEGRNDDLTALLERQISEQTGSKADLFVRLARVYAEKVGDADRAFDQLEAALSDTMDHPPAVEMLEGIMRTGKSAEERARAAEQLEPVYARRGDFKAVLATLEARVPATQDPEERKSHLRRIASIHEEQAESAADAMEALARLLAEDLSDRGTWADLERVARTSGREARLAEIFEAALATVTHDEEHTRDMAQRAGELFAAQGNAERALVAYRRALAFSPESREVFDAVDKLLVTLARPKERAELYRAFLDHADGDAARVPLLHTLAVLEEKDLGDRDTAIDTLRRVLDIDDRDAAAQDALARLYRDAGRFRDLAELVERRVEQAEDVEIGAAHRLVLARLLRNELADPTAAIDQLEALLQAAPWNRAAIAELESLAELPDHKARVVDILLPLYERGDDVGDLVRVRQTKLALLTDAGEKTAELLEIAQLLEQKKGDKPAAFAAVRQAFDLDPESGDVRQLLDRLAAELKAWDDLAASYEQAIAKVEPLSKRELLLALAKLHDARRDDPRAALSAYGRLYDLDPSDIEPLEAMDQLAMMLSDWAAVVDVLAKRAELVVADDERASLFRRIGEAKRDMMDDPKGAVAAYERALELDPESSFTVDCLIDLFEPQGMSDRLLALYRRRVELLSSDDQDAKYELLVKIAAAEEDVFSRRREAIDALREALAARPADAAVLTSLDRLYRREELWSDLLDNLRLRAASADSREARVDTRRAMGDLYRDKLEDPREALECYRLVLDDAPEDKATIDAVMGIGDAREDLRRDAAELLEPVMRAAGKHEDLVRVLRLRLRSETDPRGRAQILRNVALTEEHSLGNAKAAAGALIEALADAPDDDTIHDEIERISEAVGSFAAYADALTERVANLFDAELGTRLRTRLGRVAETKLGDDARAIAAYKAAVDEGGDTPALLASLDRLYEKTGNAKALADVIERRVATAESEGARADLYARLGALEVEKLGDRSGGLGHLRLALEAQPTHEGARAALTALLDGDAFEEASEALFAAYRAANDYVALAGLLERRIARAPSVEERVRMRLDLARVIEDDQRDPLRAQRALEAALAEAPRDAAVTAELERIAPITGDWIGLATAMETAVDKGDLGSDAAKELYVRAAIWARDRGGSAERAEALFEKARAKAPEDVEILVALESLRRAPGREAALVDTLRARAKLESSADERRSLLRQAKGLADAPLGDQALALSILEDMLKENDADLWALEELSILRDRAGDDAEHARLLERRAELVTDPTESAGLRHRAALLVDEKLGDKPRATALYERLAEESIEDDRATSALVRLYADAKKHAELARLLERLIDAAKSATERTRLRLQLAELSSGALGRESEAVEIYRAVLDEEAGHAEAVTKLSDLFEKGKRDDELAELLTKQIEVAKGRDDRDAELAFLVRLGDIYDSRLKSPERAIETYRGVLARDGSHRGALQALARLLEARNDLDGAYGNVEKLLSLSAGDEAIGLALRGADLAKRRKSPADERSMLERGLGIDDHHADIRARLLSLYEVTESWAELATMLADDASRAEAASDKVRLLLKAAVIHREKRADAKEAARLLETAAAAAPDDRDVLLALSDAYTSSGESDKAIATLERVRDSFGGKRTKELAVIHQRIAQAHLAAGAKDKALAELDAAFKIDPGNLATLRDLGQLTMDLGDLDRAGKTYRALLLQKLDAGAAITKAEVFFHLGEVSHRQGDKAKAIQMLERAIENDAGLQKAKDLLAQVKG